MMKIETYQMTNEGMTGFANQVKDLLSEIEGHEELKYYTVVASNVNVFGKMWQKFFGKDENHLKLQVLKPAAGWKGED